MKAFRLILLTVPWLTILYSLSLWGVLLSNENKATSPIAEHPSGKGYPVSGPCPRDWRKPQVSRYPAKFLRPSPND